MSEFKVGDRVRFIENSMLHEGIIIENCGRWAGYLYDNYLVKSMIGEFNILAPSLVLDNCINETKFKDLEQRIEKLEEKVDREITLEMNLGKPNIGVKDAKAMCKLKPLISNEPKLVAPTESNTSLLTEDERVILRNLDKKWKWIARDEDTRLTIFSRKPQKEYYKWDVTDVMDFENFYIFNHLFQFIKWTDKEPYNIEELLKGECEE